MDKYFECKKCFYKTYRKSDIISHLNKLKKCSRKEESYKYNEDELYNLSLIRNDKINNNEDNNDGQNKCKNCNKCFSTIGNLRRHMLASCKSTNNINITQNINNNINNINNNITQNINIIINPFNSKWSTDHIDINEQYDLLKECYIYKNTLEKILENDKNLNVLIKKDEALVYNNDKIEKFELTKLFRLMFEKVCDTILEFGNNVKNSEEIDKNLTIIKKASELANELFNDYKCNNNDTKNKAKTMFTNIYKNKSEKTEEILKNVKNASSSIDIDTSNYF